MLKGFRDFLLRGNVVDLAVAVVIGAAFTSIISALNEGVITQLIAAIGGAPDFTKEAVKIGDTPIYWGRLVTAILNFVIVAAVIYFLIVTPMNRALARFKRDDAEAQVTKEQELLMEIRDLLAAQRR